MRAIRPNIPGLPTGTLAANQPQYTPLPFAEYNDGQYGGATTRLTRWRLDADEVRGVAQAAIATALMKFAGSLPRLFPELAGVPTHRLVDALETFAKEARIPLDVPMTEAEHVDLWLHTLTFGEHFQPVTLALATEAGTRALIRSKGSDT